MTTPELLAARVQNLHPIGSKYVLLQIKLPQAYPQNPGQYCFLELDDSKGPFLKPYSIASEPRHDGIVELCLLTGDERTQKALQGLKSGDLVRLSSAQGRFNIPALDSPGVFIAGGSGISPLRSMIRDRFNRAGSDAGPSVLIYGCEHAAEIPYFDEFQEMTEQYSQFQVTYFVEQGAGPQFPPAVKEGLATAGIANHVALAQEFYLCGPPAMMAACSAELLAHGIKADQVFTDQY